MLVVLSVTIVAVLVCVALHGATFYWGGRWLLTRARFRFWQIGFLILVAIVAHLAEIAIFQLAYLPLAARPENGTIVGADPARSLDLLYFSAVTYTSLGYGDLTPLGRLRWVAAVETVTGLILIAWTASFTFLAMQRFWQKELASGKEE